jgi:stringent starvation protein B
MPQPIYIRDDALVSDFSFSGQVHTCRVPMDRIWAAYLPEGDMEHGIVWEEDVPETIRAVVSAVRSLKDEEPAPAEAIQNGGEQATHEVAQTVEKTAERKIRHLRVVK